MLGRILVFTIGVGVGIVVVLKARDYVQHKLPAAVTDKVNETTTGIVDRIADFASDARAAMAERETELRDALGLVEDLDADQPATPSEKAPRHAV
ncbi:DUF6167 family protein [Propionibacteriaceae bacterium Y2011]|uniref:DUF6167 family protein n=1 Tax=Microlunatus sp. Y2014 TaxID=3418488 RepID=UPI003B4AF5B6